MVEEKIVEEIYNVLVEQFGINEIFLPKYGKSRPNNIAWKHFIKAALELKAEDLYGYCGYSSAANFSKYINSTYPNVSRDRQSKNWFIYFSALILKKRCSCCGSILDYNNFSKNSGTKDGLRGRCKSCISLDKKEYYQDNKEDIKSKSRKYRQLNRNSIIKKQKIFYAENKYLFYSYNAKRRAAKLQASPLWADQEKVKQIYKECPEDYHVDHIVPLQHPLVCGLHCEFNLQHLPAAKNLSKSNRFDIDKQE